MRGQQGAFRWPAPPPRGGREIVKEETNGMQSHAANKKSHAADKTTALRTTKNQQKDLNPFCWGLNNSAPSCASRSKAFVWKALFCLKYYDVFLEGEQYLNYFLLVAWDLRAKFQKSCNCSWWVGNGCTHWVMAHLYVLSCEQTNWALDRVNIKTDWQVTFKYKFRSNPIIHACFWSKYQPQNSALAFVLTSTLDFLLFSDPCAKSQCTIDSILGGGIKVWRMSAWGTLFPKTFGVKQADFPLTPTSIQSSSSVSAITYT